MISFISLCVSVSTQPRVCVCPAEAELKDMIETLASSSQNFENSLIRHNLVVFRQGENALQVLPPLLDVIPEARLNLVIYYMKQGEYAEAFELIKEVEPTTPPQYILKVIACVSVCVSVLVLVRVH
jgi:intraflagellar transport protein 56